jgi:hypothetical protein
MKKNAINIRQYFIFNYSQKLKKESEYRLSESTSIEYYLAAHEKNPCEKGVNRCRKKP